jgi:predicted nuclease with TOPRIM domain
VLRQLERQRDELALLQDGLTELSDRIQSTVDEAVRLQHRQEEVVDALRSENKIFNDVMLPTLNAACENNLQRYRAETEIQTMRRVASTKDEG